MIEAVRLLVETEWTLDAIARLVGYASTKNLYRALRQTTGLSPGGIRRTPGF